MTYSTAHLTTRALRGAAATASLTTACATTSANPDLAPVPSAATATQVREQVIVDPAADAVVLQSSVTRAPAFEARVDAPPATVYALLAAAYEQVGLRHTTYDTSARTLGAVNVRVANQVGGVALARYVECGNGTLADGSLGEYRVRLSLYSRVSPQASGSVVSSQLFATAVRPAASNFPVPCRSTGRLETAVGAAVRDLLVAVGAR